jgi:hypothetical protein
LQAAQIPEFKGVIKMLRKHEAQLINYFRQGLKLNGKIQRFASNSYGLTDKDFFLYRVSGRIFFIAPQKKN